MPSVSRTATSPQTPRVAWWLWFNVLSLDAPIVAVLWQEALARTHRIHLLPGSHVTLFLAVWLIYLIDRTLDSFAPAESHRLTARHRFYRRNRWLFLSLAIPAASLLLLNLAMTTIPGAVMLRGALLAFLVGIYLLHYAARSHRTLYLAGNLLFCSAGLAVVWWLPLNREYQILSSAALTGMMAVAVNTRWHGGFRLVPKELICGYLFAVGCSLSVSFHTMDSHAGPFSPEVLLMALLFALNCVAIACYERRTDAASDPHSISQVWPGIVRVYPALLLSFAVLAVCIVQRHWEPQMIFLGVAVTASTALLAALHYFAPRLTPDLSRVLADAAVVLPVVLLIARA